MKKLALLLLLSITFVSCEDDELSVCGTVLGSFENYHQHPYELEGYYVVLDTNESVKIDKHTYYDLSIGEFICVEY